MNDGTGHSSAEYTLIVQLIIVSFGGLMLLTSLILMFATYPCGKCRKYVPKPKEVKTKKDQSTDQIDVSSKPSNAKDLAQDKVLMNLSISNDLKNRYTEELQKKYEKSFNEIDQDLTTEPVF